MSGGTVLVTGAGGFIGGALVDRLSAAGRPVRAGLRSSPPERVSPRGVRQVLCDLDSRGDLDAALLGVDAVVHTAVGRHDRMEAQMEALLAAADRAAVRHFVMFSSVAVYGEREGRVREDDAPMGRIDAYGAAKRRCEARLKSWAEKPAPGGIRTATVLRPGIVYGRHSRFWIDDLSDRIRAAVLGTFGAAGEGIAALVHVDDVVDAARLALDRAPPGFTAFNLVGFEQPTWNAYFAALAARLGPYALRDIGPRELAARQAFAIPAKILALCGMPVSAARVPLPAEMRLFGRRADYDTASAAAVLGWEPRVDLAEGLSLSLPDQVSTK